METTQSSSAITQAEMEGEQEVTSKEKRCKREHRPPMSPEEHDLIHRLHRLLGNRWLLISRRIPGRSAKEVERYWEEVERKMYRETKLFKPKCLKPSTSFKFHMEATIDDNVGLAKVELELPIHVLKEGNTISTNG